MSIIAEVGCEGDKHSISGIGLKPLVTERMVILQPCSGWSEFNDGPNDCYRARVTKLGIPVITADIYANPETWLDLNIGVIFLENVLNDPTSLKDYFSLAANLKRSISPEGVVFIIDTFLNPKYLADYRELISSLEPEFEVVFDDLTTDIMPSFEEEFEDYFVGKLAKVITSMPADTTDHPLIERLNIESENPHSRWLVFKKKPLPAEDLL